MRTPGSILIATAMTLCSGGVVLAQSNNVTTPAKGSTGPTVPETRPVDQRPFNMPAGGPAADVFLDLKEPLFEPVEQR